MKTTTTSTLWSAQITELGSVTASRLEFACCQASELYYGDDHVKYQLYRRSFAGYCKTEPLQIASLASLPEFVFSRKQAASNLPKLEKGDILTQKLGSL